MDICFHGNDEYFFKTMAIFIEGMSQRVFTTILNKFHDYAFPTYSGPYRELVLSSLTSELILDLHIFG